MCIRDREKTAEEVKLKIGSAFGKDQRPKSKNQNSDDEKSLDKQERVALVPVSYTHLTLPTSDLV